MKHWQPYLLSIPLLLLSCQPPRVVHFTNSAAKFEAYSTFSIDSDMKRLENESEELKRVVSRMDKAIKEEMEKRNYKMNRYSDLTVFYQVVVDKSVDIDVNRNMGMYGSYYPYSPYNFPYVTERVRKEGVLIIDIKETYTERLIWQGSLELNNMKNSDHPMEEAVSRIFEEYPYLANQAEPVMIN